MTKLTWSTKQIKLGDLKEWDKNPVRISERAAKELAKSLTKFDHVLPYVAAAPKNGHGLPLLDGHQRKQVELALNKVSPNTLVDVRIPSRKLTDKERQELVIRLRKNTGEFDFDKLANFIETEDLLDWGFNEDELVQAVGFFGDEKIPEKTEKIKPRERLHILITIDLAEDLESVMDIRERIGEIEKLSGVEVVYGSN